MLTTAASSDLIVSSDKHSNTSVAGGAPKRHRHDLFHPLAQRIHPENTPQRPRAVKQSVAEVSQAQTWYCCWFSCSTDYQLSTTTIWASGNIRIPVKSLPPIHILLWRGRRWPTLGQRHNSWPSKVAMYIDPFVKRVQLLASSCTHINLPLSQAPLLSASVRPSAPPGCRCAPLSVAPLRPHVLVPEKCPPPSFLPPPQWRPPSKACASCCPFRPPSLPPSCKPAAPLVSSRPSTAQLFTESFSTSLPQIRHGSLYRLCASTSRRRSRCARAANRRLRRRRRSSSCFVLTVLPPLPLYLLAVACSPPPRP